MKILINNEGVTTGIVGGTSMSMISLQLKYVVIVVALIRFVCISIFAEILH